MKVCLLTGEYPPMQGGIGDYCQKLSHALQATGTDVIILTSTKAEERQDNAYPIISKWSFGSWAKIKGVLQTTGSDIVHIQYQTAAFGMHPAVNLLPYWIRFQTKGCRIITTMHDLRVPYLFPKAGRLRQWVNQALVRGSHAVVATNEDDFLTLRSASSHRQLIRLIPLGDNLPPQPADDFDRVQWRQKLGLGENVIVLCYFGFLNSSKGMETLLEAFRKLLDQRMPLKLLMIGASTGDSDPTNRPYQDKIHGLAASLGLEGSIIWTGYLPQAEISACLLSSDICVLPFKDGASFRRTSLITAMSHSLPIVTTTRAIEAYVTEAIPSPLPRLIHGENCLLTQPDDSAALAVQIKSLIDDPNLRRRLSEAAATAARAFSWERTAKETTELYREILGRAEYSPSRISSGRPT